MAMFFNLSNLPLTLTLTPTPTKPQPPAPDPCEPVERLKTALFIRLVLECLCSSRCTDACVIIVFRIPRLRCFYIFSDPAKHASTEMWNQRYRAAHKLTRQLRPRAPPCTRVQAAPELASRDNTPSLRKHCTHVLLCSSTTVCITMYCHVLLRITMYCYVLLSVTMYYHVLLCIGTYYHGPL